MLVGDARIRKLNKEWRKKDKATDVLSFPLLGAADLKQAAKVKGPLPLGDIVISVPTARRQAKERGHSLALELDLLLVHGLLHLLGYDHEISPAEATRMRRLETKVLGHTMIG